MRTPKTMLISIGLLVLANLFRSTKTVDACRSTCDCQDDLTICRLTTKNSTANSAIVSRSNDLKSMRRSMREVGIVSLDVYVFGLVESKTDYVCDNDRLSEFIRGCCRETPFEKNASAKIVFRSKNACWRIAYDLTRNSTSILRNEVDHRFLSINRSVSEFLETLDEFREERVSPESEQSGAFSISTVVALLVPACVSLLVLPFAILAVYCCCRRCSMRKKPKEKSKKKGLAAFEQLKTQRSIYPIAISDVGKTTILEIDKMPTAKSPETVEAFKLRSPSIDRSKIGTESRSISRKKSASTPDLTSAGSADTCPNLTLSRIAAYRDLLRRGSSSGGEESVENGGVTILDLWNTADVPDEFYAVFVHSDAEFDSGNNIDRWPSVEANNRLHSPKTCHLMFAT